MASMFGGAKTVAAPTPEPTPPMPDSTSPAVTEAARLQQQQIMGRAGRQSTILTTPQNRATNKYDSYTAKSLGTSPGT